MTYFFHPAAEAEHLETLAFYLSRQTSGLPEAYLADFEAAMAHVVKTPLRYRIERKPDIRRYALARFPYAVIYRVKNGDIHILAVAHKRRRPDYWTGRL